MIKVCFVRGKYLNNFEGQNYRFKDISFTAISSLYPLNREFSFPVVKLPSLADLPGRAIKYLANRILGDSQILFGLEKFAGKFDIFHTADPHYFYSYQLAKLRKKRLIKKLVVTSWETIPFNNETVSKKKFIKYFVIKNSDFFICYSQSAKSVLVSEGVNEKKIMIIRLGVDLNQFKPDPDKMTRSRHFVRKEEMVILFVGRLVKEKGVLDLYDAFRFLKSKMSSVKSDSKSLKLKIVGGGPLRNYLLTKIKSDKLANDVSIEKKEYGEIPKIYQQADLFVLPSKKTGTWEEQYGMVLVEAMASGLPIVAYDSGVISEIVGSAGILVKEGNKKNLLVSINRLIETQDLRDKLGKMGRERAEKYFDAKKTAKKISLLYKKIVNS